MKFVIIYISCKAWDKGFLIGGVCMKTRLLKKVIWVSALTSAVASSIGLFFSYSPKQNFANQNGNTSSLTNIYSQKITPSNASLNKSTLTPNVPTKKASKNNLIPQMTPYSSKLIKKPVITFLGFKPPSSPTATDGEAYYDLGSDVPHITWGLFHQGPNSDTFDRAQTNFSDPHKVVVSNLKLGDEIQLNLKPKDGYAWDDGTSDQIFDPIWRSISTNKLTKPVITFLGFKEPSSPTATDGEAYYHVENYYSNYMFWSINRRGPDAADVFTRASMSSARDKLTLKNLKLGDEFQLYFYPKKEKGYKWDDGTTYNVEDSNFRMILSKSQKPVITFLGFKPPSSPTATDGEAYYHVENYKTHFDWDVVSNKLLNNDVVNRAKFFFLQEEITLKNLKLNDDVALILRPGKGYVWNDATNADVIDQGRFIYKSPNTVKKPTFTKVVKQPTTTTSTDGEVTYTLTNFDPKIMRISLSRDSNGKLGIFNPSNNTIKVTSLKSGQKAKIKVEFKNLGINQLPRESIYTLKPAGVEDDNTDSPKMHAKSFISNQVVGVHIPKNSALEFSTDLFSSVLATAVNPTFEDIWNENTAQKKVFGFFIVDEVSKKLTYNGKSVETYANSAEFILDGLTSTGSASQIKLQVWAEAFNKSTRIATIKYKLSLSINGEGEDNGIMTGLRLNLVKNLPFLWEGGITKPIYSEFGNMQQTYVGLQKPTFTKVVKQPTTTTSTDGEATYTLTNFIPSKMTITLSPGSNGSLGKYEPATNQVKVTGLKVGQQTQIQIGPKINEWWINGTTIPQKSSIFTPKQPYSGFTKTIFTHVVKQPTTSTSTDGKVSFKLIHFDQAKMTITLAPSSSGTLGIFNPKNNTIKVTHLSSGQHAQIQVTPRKFSTWKDGTRATQLSSKVGLLQAYIGLKKPIFTNIVKQPTTTTSTDGQVTFTITNFDPVNMTLSIAPGAGGSLEQFNTKTKVIKVSHLSSGQYAQIQLTLKNNNTWTDGSVIVANSRSVNLVTNVVGLKKPIFTNTVKQPTTSTSNDGEAAFTVTNFFPSKMTITLAPSSSGTLGIFNPKNNTIKVTHLSSGQHAQIQVTLKVNESWINASKLAIKSSIVHFDQKNIGVIKPTFTKVVKQPTTSTSSDGEVIFTIVYYNPSIMKVSLVPGSGGTLGVFDSNNNKIKVTHLSSGQHAQIQVKLKQNNTWTDATNSVIHSTSVQLTQTNIGLAKILFTHKVKKPTTKTSTDGEANFILANFDKNKMYISLAPGSGGTLGTFNPKNNTIKVTHLSSGQHAQIQVTLKVKNIWVDGTSVVANSPSLIMNQTRIGLKKTTFTQTIKQPTTTKSHDGEVTFTLIDFDPTKMDISLVPGSNGILGKYNSQAKQIKVTSVAVGQIAQIQVTPKTNNFWDDATTTPQVSSSFKPSQTFVGLTKPTFTYVVKQPTTKTSKDGEVTFTLTNFDPQIMNLSVAAGSNGHLASFNPKSKSIKVKLLSSGQHAQIQVTLKANDIWENGSILPIKSKLVSISQQHLGVNIPAVKYELKQPTTTTSTDGRVTFQLTGFNSAKMDISLAPGSGGQIGAFDSKTSTIKVINLMHGQYAQIQFVLKSKLIWEDGKTTPFKSFKIIIQHNDAWLKRVVISSVISRPTMKKSRDGKVIFRLKNFQPSKMSVDLVKGSDGFIGTYEPTNETLEVVGLSNSENAQVKVSLKGDQYWLDGTNESVKSKKVTITENSVKSIKIIEKEFVQPTSTTPGAIILTLEKYDVDNIIAKIIGSHGSIGAYNGKTRQIKITGLQKNEKVEFEFSLKPKHNKTGLKNWWDNGTDEPEKVVLFMGYKKNLFKNIELSEPTKANFKDGQVIFELLGFDPLTMEVELSDLSSGVLGKYDTQNKKIKVSELNTGETAQIKIFFKDKTLIWFDGSRQQIESEKVKIPDSYAKAASISSSNEGMSKLLLAGIIIGALIVVNIGWIGMYKIMKSRRDF